VVASSNQVVETITNLVPMFSIAAVLVHRMTIYNEERNRSEMIKTFTETSKTFLHAKIRVIHCKSQSYQEKFQRGLFQQQQVREQGHQPCAIGCYRGEISKQIACLQQQIISKRDAMPTTQI
jgi:hypothetical protein